MDAHEAEEAEILAMIRRDIDAQFPKTCTRCGTTYATLLDFISRCQHIGRPVALSRDEMSRRPFGVLALANCACGTTLSISSLRMTDQESERLERWVSAEAARRGIALDQVLEYVRDRVDAQALADAERLATTA